MDWREPKRFQQLPVFQVTKIDAGEPGNLVVIGVFSSLDGVEEGPAYLLRIGESLDSVWGEFTSISVQNRIASFVGSRKDLEGWMVGEARYLAGGWQPHQVWMISVPKWKWEQRSFCATDAVATRLPATAAPAPPTGKPVKFWLELASVTSPGQKRFYPDRDVPEGLVVGGWDHAHCELCHGNIESGQLAYRDRGGHWLCTGCHQRYICPA